LKLVVFTSSKSGFWFGENLPKCEKKTSYKILKNNSLLGGKNPQFLNKKHQIWTLILI
jgi:hypothetical protein